MYMFQIYLWNGSETGMDDTGSVHVVKVSFVLVLANSFNMRMCIEGLHQAVSFKEG